MSFEPAMISLNVIDLFSGCGGSALGFYQEGFPIKVAVDKDKNASESFKLNFPESEVFTEDIRSLSGDQLIKAAGLKSGKDILLIACPPCQGFSNARRNSERTSDPRNELVYEFLRIVEEIKPTAFVMENVPGLATGIGKSMFSDILDKLHTLGYQTIHDVVNTADYGIPQRRKRLIVLGTNNPDIKLSFLVKTNSDPNKPSDLILWNTVRKTIGDLPRIEAGQKSQKDIMHVSANLSETNLKRIKQTPHDGGDRMSWSEDLILNCHKTSNGHKDVYGRMRWNKPSPTITGGCAMISKGRFGHPEQNRAISLREAARLQTFPDDYKFAGNFGQIAEQIGNAVPPLLARRAAEALRNAIEDRKKVKKTTSHDRRAHSAFQDTSLSA